MILDILKNKIAAVAVTAAVAGGGAVTYQTLVPPPEEDVYRVTYLLNTEDDPDPDRLSEGTTYEGITYYLENVLCDMRIGADRECKYKLNGGSTLYIRGDARNPRGFSVGEVWRGDIPHAVSENLTHTLIEDMEAGLRIYSKSKYNPEWYDLLTMRRLTAEEVAELDRPRVAVSGTATGE